MRACGLSTHVITETTARLDAQHTLGSRRTKGRSLYQVVCHQNQWVGLILWTGAVWHIKARDLPRQWEECFGYPPLLAETFTDPESHAGTCYKASGWTPVGFSSRDGRHYADNFPQLGSKKMWIKPLTPQAKTLLRPRVNFPKSMKRALRLTRGNAVR